MIVLGSAALSSVCCDLPIGSCAPGPPRHTLSCSPFCPPSCPPSCLASCPTFCPSCSFEGLCTRMPFVHSAQRLTSATQTRATTELFERCSDRIPCTNWIFGMQSWWSPFHAEKARTVLAGGLVARFRQKKRLVGRLAHRVECSVAQ